MGKAIFILVLAVVLAAGTVAFRHYNDCYIATIRADEGWLHLQPWNYVEVLDEAAPDVRDHVSLAGTVGQSVAVLSANDGLFSRGTLSDFTGGARAELEGRSEVRGVRDPRRWIRDLEWRGPGIAYSL